MMNHGKIRWILGLVTIAFLMTPTARADVVNPPADGQCPEGTSPSDSHGLNPSWCHAIACKSNSDCKSGTVCKKQALCSTGGGVVGQCAGGKKCPYNSPCKQLQVCVSPSTPRASKKKGCAVSPSDQGPSDLGLIFAGLLLALVRARTRRV
jgi:MYXO-CTERM domain-containing protein